MWTPSAARRRGLGGGAGRRGEAERQLELASSLEMAPEVRVASQELAKVYRKAAEEREPGTALGAKVGDMFVKDAGGGGPGYGTLSLKHIQESNQQAVAQLNHQVDFLNAQCAELQAEVEATRGSYSSLCCA